MQISVFNKYLLFYYKKYKIIITLSVALFFINMSYYIYWTYYIISMFYFYKNNIDCIDYYNENNSTFFYHNIPSVDINISLFDLQNTIWYIIIWSTLIVVPYLMLNLSSYKSNVYYYINIVLGLYSIIMLIHIIYIPNIIWYYYEYYQIYQTQHESLSVNIEYNLVNLISNIIYLIISYTAIVILSTTSINRYVVIYSYIIIMPWNQPTMVIIVSLIGAIITIEIISLVYFGTLNYLAKIAGLCTDAHT